MLQEITKQKELDQLSRENKIIVLDFYAEWCAPCKMLMPAIEELANFYANDNRIKVIKANVEKAQSLAKKYDILSVPTILFLQNGEMVDFLPGLTSKEIIVEKIEALI